MILKIEHKTGNSYSFKHFENDCLIIANHWAKFGLKKDDKFAIISQNSFECAVSLIGGIFVGGIAVPISRDYLPSIYFNWKNKRFLIFFSN